MRDYLCRVTLPGSVGGVSGHLRVVGGELAFAAESVTTRAPPGTTSGFRMRLGGVWALHVAPDGFFLEGEAGILLVRSAAAAALHDTLTAAIYAADADAFAWQQGGSLTFGWLSLGRTSTKFHPREGAAVAWGPVVAAEPNGDVGAAGRTWVLRREGAEPVWVQCAAGRSLRVERPAGPEHRESFRLPARIRATARRRGAGGSEPLDAPVVLDVSRRGVSIETGPGPRSGDLVDLEVHTAPDGERPSVHHLSGRVVSVLPRADRVRIGVFVPEAAVGRLYDVVQREMLRRRAAQRESDEA